jgi:hypothetical protein
MSKRQKREHCVEILLQETLAVLAVELRDETQPVPPIEEGFRRLDRPAVLRILVRTRRIYRPDMAGFLIQSRPDLEEYIGECLAYLEQSDATEDEIADFGEDIGEEPPADPDGLTSEEIEELVALYAMLLDE